MMDFTQIRELVSQVQTSARVTTAIGDPIQVGDRIVIPVVEVMYGGGGGGGGGKTGQVDEGSGGGGGGGVRVRPLGCWIIGPTEERWVPSIDYNRLIMVVGTFAALALLTIRKVARRR